MTSTPSQGAHVPPINKDAKTKEAINPFFICRVTSNSANYHTCPFFVNNQR